MRTDEERHRWDLAYAIASAIYAGDGAHAIFYAAVALFNSDIPT